MMISAAFLLRIEINHYEAKQNSVQVDAFKKLARIIKGGGSFDRILLTVSNLWINTNTLKYSNESVLQGILDLYSEAF